MTEGIPEHTLDQLERDLAALYFNAAPEHFAQRLEGQLHTRAEELRAARQDEVPWRRRFVLSRRPALAFALVVVLILAGIVASLGPQRVLAAMQSLLGYVPGMGFVDLDSARVLASPVSITREGVTFQLVQLVAQPDKTLVTFLIKGLPEIILQNPETDDFQGGFNPNLVLPNGESYGLNTMEYGGQGSNRHGKITFPPIPPDVQNAWLSFDYLPDISSGEFPKGWQIPFTLRPAGGHLPAREAVDILVPDEASMSAHGVTMQIVQVARSSAETAIHLRFEWQDPTWSYESSSIPLLQDNYGHFYHELNLGTSGIAVEQVVEIIEPVSVTPTVLSPTGYLDATYLYPSLSSAARKITLSLPNMTFTVPADTSFGIDLGHDPQIGQSWKIDQHVHVAGFDVYIPEVHLVEYILPGESGTEQKSYLLRLAMQPESLADKNLTMINLETDSVDVIGGSYASDYDPGPIFAAIEFSRLPEGRINFIIREAEITVPGPWEISLDLLDTGEDQPRVQVLHPQPAETHNGVTLSIAEVLRTDLMTLVKLALPDLPSGARLVSTDYKHASLEDKTGEMLGSGSRGWWDSDPSELRFPSSLNYSGELTLQVPTVEVFYPGEAAWVVDVPESLVFHEEKENGTDDSSVAEVQYLSSRWVSDPWSVDLPVEIAGHRLVFNQARLERDENNLPNRYRLEIYTELTAAQPDAPYLKSLRVSSILRPDGETQTVDYLHDPYGMWGSLYSLVVPGDSGSSDWVASVQFDVTAADRFNLLPGRYVVNFAGAVVAVPGPWRLSWTGEEP